MGLNSKIEILREIQKELEVRKTKQIFYCNDFITIVYNAHSRWIYADWKGYQTESSVKEGCEKILSALSEYKCIKILNDNTNVVGIWTPAAQWVGADWFPRLIQAGLKYFAWVYSASTFSALSADEAIKYTPQESTIRKFSDTRDAALWLKQVS